MEKYIIALCGYIVLMVALKLFMNLKNKRNGTTKKTNAQQGRNDNSKYHEAKGDTIQRSRPRVSPKNEYEALSIEEGIYTPVPSEIWLARWEHDTFVEYLREDLAQHGILMNDIEI